MVGETPNMNPQKGDYKFDQELLEKLSLATGVTKDQMRQWVVRLAESLGYKLEQWK